MTTTAYPDPGTPQSPVADPGVAAHAASTTQQASTLPFTGGDVTGLAAIGLGAVLAGAAIVRRSRRPRVA